MHPKAQVISSKVRYEWEMLRYAYQQIQNQRNITEERHINMLLEDFLLHSRVLRDFFVQEPKNKDDVSASHFFDDPSIWNSIKSSHCAYLQKNRTRLNKYLAHLSYDRLNEDKRWDIKKIFNEINNVWKAFYSILPPERRIWFN